jgi:hypothetical protein
VLRALPVAREEDSGNIDFYEVSPSIEERKIIADCKNAGIKAAWSKWTSKKSVSSGPDQTVFGDEKGCIYLSTDLLKQRRPAPKKKPTKKPMVFQKKPSEEAPATPKEEATPSKPSASKKRAAPEADPPSAKKSRQMTLTITFDDYDALKTFAERL